MYTNQMINEKPINDVQFYCKIEGIECSTLKSTFRSPQVSLKSLKNAFLSSTKVVKK